MQAELANLGRIDRKQLLSAAEVRFLYPALSFLCPPSGVTDAAIASAITSKQEYRITYIGDEHPTSPLYGKG